MDNICENVDAGETYYVYGSGLMAVPYSRMNEIPKLKSEFHSREVDRALMATQARKLA